MQRQKLNLLKLQEAKRCKSNFYTFFKCAWYAIWPETEFQDNWHFKIICNKIQEAALRVINNIPREKDLCFNVPPGTSKSTIISICLNAWVWIYDPNRRFITTSYSPGLADEHCTRTRRLIESDWYQSLFGQIYHLIGTADTYLETNKGGSRMTTSPGSQVATGFHADFILFDDPDSAKGVMSEAKRKETIQWFDETMPSRLANPQVGLKIIVQQRLHVADVTGHVLREYPEKFDYVILPAIATTTIFPRELVAYYKDNHLFPNRLTPKVLDDYKKRLRNGYAGQFLMTPLAIGGNFFRDNWPKWYTKEQLPVLEQVIVSVDASFSAAEGSCNASIQVWGKKRPNYYMIYDLTTKMGALQTAAAITRITEQYRGATLVIEKAANGYFLIEQLKKKFSIYEFIPSKFGGKEIRAEMVAPLWEQGNIYIYNSQYNKTEYLPEILIFPNSDLKDRVDAMSQALLYFTRCNQGIGGFGSPNVF